MRKRFQDLRNSLLESTPEICVERCVITTEAYQQYECYPVIEKRARALADVLNKMSLYIEEGQVLIGNQASTPRAAPLYPEYDFEFILAELDQFEERSSDQFHISEKNKDIVRNTLPWWKGKTLKARSAAMQTQEALDDKAVGVLGWQGNVTSGEGHIVPDYENALKKGFTGLLSEVEERMDLLDLAVPSDLEKLSFFRACKIVLEGCLDYIQRCRDLLVEKISQCEDALRARELDEMASRCDALLNRAPKSFAEALQFVWFVHVILHIETNGHSISLGRLDQYLYPYYIEDISSGTLSKEEAETLMGCFYLKIYTNNKLRAWGTTQTQLGYVTYQNLCLGGQKTDGSDAVNELSWLCLQTLGEIRLPEPNIYVRVHDNLDDRFLNYAVKLVKSGLSLPAFVSDNVIIPALEGKGVSHEDAMNYSTMGCTEVLVPGKWCYRANGKSKVNLARILEIVLNGGVDNHSGKLIIKGITPLDQCTDIDQIKEGYRKAINHYIKMHVTIDNTNELAMCALTPDAFCSLLIRDCLERGKAIKEGGAVYDMISGTLVGIANVGNAVYAIKKLCFDEKKISPAELKSALDSNFAGERGKYIQTLLLHGAEKFGNDCDEVDQLTKELSDYYAKEIGNYKTLRYGKGPVGCCYTSSTVTITANVSCGKVVGATPDGRFKGEPLADGISPSRNTIRNGVTAVFQSVGKISTEEFTGGQLLNIRMNPSSLETEEDEQKFASLLKASGNINCWHSQYNVLTDETLRDAQRHPRNYSDLVVRVAGYSAMFVSLNKELQEDIIARTEFNTL